MPENVEGGGVRSKWMQNGESATLVGVQPSFIGWRAKNSARLLMELNGNLNQHTHRLAMDASGAE